MRTVLEKLRKRKKGITVMDFPTGTRLAARIYDLRCRGFEIITITKKHGPARYVLLREPG